MVPMGWTLTFEFKMDRLLREAEQATILKLGDRGLHLRPLGSPTTTEFKDCIQVRTEGQFWNLVRLFQEVEKALPEAEIFMRDDYHVPERTRPSDVSRSSHSER
jgi:hypothetical protein